MEGNFSSRVNDVIRLSRDEALRLGHDYIGTEHLLLGIIREGEGLAVKILKNLGTDLYKLKKSIEDTVKPTSSTLTLGNIPLTKQAEKVLKITYLEAKLYKSEIIVQPNPATEYININLSSINPTLKRGVEGEVFIEIYDVMGMKIQSTPFNLTPTLSEGEGARIDISNLTPGVYFVKIGDRVEKFVKY